MVEIKNILGKTDEASVLQLEALFERRLPSDYRSFLLEYNGGIPRKNLFGRRFWKGANEIYDHEIDIFLGINNMEISDIRNAYYSLSFKSPIPLVPIAYVSLEELLVISLDNSTYGSVCFFSNEDEYDDLDEVNWEEAEVTKMADNFSSFLCLLEQRENDDFDDRYQQALTWYKDYTGFPTEKKTVFPREKLTVSDARLFAEIDPLGDGLLYGIDIKFEPFEYEGEKLECSLALQRIPWAVKDWRDLNGLTRKLDHNQDGYQGSFYTFEHDITHLQFLQFQERKGTFFKARLMVIPELRALFGPQNFSEVLDLNVMLTFDGLRVTQKRFGTTAEVKKYLFEKVDLQAYCEPILDRDGTWIELKPKS